MNGDPVHSHNSAGVNSQAVFDALDRVVAATPLTTQQRTDGGAIAPLAETPAPRPRLRRWSVAQVAAIALGIVASVEFCFLVPQFRGRGNAVSTPAGSMVTVESTPSGAA